MKKAFKENMKLVITAIVSIIISSSITAFAAIKISATEIGYNNTTVADQLDSLYQTMFSNNYSTEKKQVGKWIDGEPVYQITVSHTFSNKNQWEDTGVIIGNIKRIKYFSDVEYFTNATDYCSILPRVIDGQIQLYYATPYATVLTKPVYVTIQYTKTTD